MAEKKAGKIVILSSPSGAGKTTLVKKISLSNQFNISISYTTRKPRIQEKNGQDYFFVNKNEFKKLINNKKFLEYAKVFRNYYGSLKKTVVDKLERGENVIFDIDWKGTKQIKNKRLKYEIKTIFILPPSKKELFKRLLKRDQKDKKIASERMKQFKSDVMHWKDYDFTVINDNLEKCYKLIIKFIDNKKNKNRSAIYNKEFIKDHINKLVN